MLTCGVGLEHRDGPLEEAAELAEIADRYASTALRATASVAIARVQLADGDIGAAREGLGGAVRLWTEVGAPYESATAQLALGDAYLALGDHRRAAREHKSATDALAALASPAGQHPPSTLPREEATFRREGDVWSLVFAGHAVRIRDARGMHHLARLLADPGREFHVLDLVGASRGAAAPDAGDAGPMLDERAKAAYRRRLTEIDADIDDAHAAGDAGREAQAVHEREFLLAELSRAVGLGGRDRRAGSASERARVAVTRAIRHALTRITEHHPTLGEHLQHAVRTGTYCVYEPDPRAQVTWLP